MIVNLPSHPRDDIVTAIAGAVSRAFARVNPAAQVPDLGQAGDSLTKIDARGFNTQWGNPWASDTAANIASKTAAINTVGKRQGKPCYDTTNLRLMIAAGPAATDAWKTPEGGTTVTPA